MTMNMRNNNKTNLTTTVHCKYHPYANLIHDTYAGDLICPVCGLVVVERAEDARQEWIQGRSDDYDGCRVGQIETSNTDGCTSIGIQQGYNARFCDENGKSKFAFHSKVDNAQVALKANTKEIYSLCNTLNFDPQICSGAIGIMNEAAKLNLSFHKNRRAFNITCIYLACIDLNVPRTMNELLINGKFNVTEKQCRKLLKSIQLGLKRKFVVVKPSLYVTRFIFQLGIINEKMKVEKLTLKIVKIVRQISSVKSKSPVVVALSCIQMACNFMSIPVDTTKLVEHLGYGKSTIAIFTKATESYVTQSLKDCV